MGRPGVSRLDLGQRKPAQTYDCMPVLATT